MQSFVFKEALEKLDRGEYAVFEVNIGSERYKRGFVPDERLILLGGGHVSLALAKIAVMLDYSITVVDDRPQFANHERFYMADKVVCNSFSAAIDELEIRESDYVCVLTRGHQWDTVCVEKILSGGIMPYYFGMIGSKRRCEGLRNNLLEEGFEPERLAQLHAPIGIKLGGTTPSEIAVSICAEMIQKRHEKSICRGDDTLPQMNADFDTLRYLADPKEPRAMLLVLDSSGSTPVKGGAMMAVNSLGKGYGTIGGGCGEHEAITAARKLIGTGDRKVIGLDMTNEVAADNGMVCGGRMTILIEDITD